MHHFPNYYLLQSKPSTQKTAFYGGKGILFGLFCCFDLKCSLQEYWKLKTSNLLKIYNVIIIPVRKETNLLKESYHLQAQLIKEMYTINHQSIIKMYKKSINHQRNV